MARELQSIDVTDTPDVLRLAEEVASSGVPLLLRRGCQDVAVISPVEATPEQTQRSQPVGEDDSLWKIVGLADAADFPETPRDVATHKHDYLAETYDERP